MDKNLYRVEKLLRFLGRIRSDDALVKFIAQFAVLPLAIVDKEDDADDEFLEFKEYGFGFYFEKDVLLSITLHSIDNASGYVSYENPLPFGVSFGQSMSDVEKILGEPDSAGGGRKGFFGDVPVWLKYKTKTHSVHIEFSRSSKTVRAVSLLIDKK